MSEEGPERARQPAGTPGPGSCSPPPPCAQKWSEPRPCKLCGAPIVFVVSVNGKQIPLDPAASRERGNVAVDLVAGRGRVLGPEDAKAARAAGAILHISHFATCTAYQCNDRSEKRI